MKHNHPAIPIALSLLLNPLIALAADPAPGKPTTRPATAPASKPALKIVPGQVIVPTDNMRRPWGELISVDLATRTGTFRREGTDEVMRFVAMPYAEMLHHATFGDLSDFKVGERLIFRLHPNDAGEWVWLTYIQDEMNMMNGHKEYFFVDAVDAAKGEVTCTQANADKSYVREQGIVIRTDADTRFWKAGRPATFADVRPGDKLRTKTHGVGKGKVRVAWEVFLDDESLLKFQAEQKAVHAARMQKDGAPGYVDEADGAEVKLTMFQESNEVSSKLRPGKPVLLSPAGDDRAATRTGTRASVVAAKAQGKLYKVTVKLDAGADDLKPGNVARLWLAE